MPICGNICENTEKNKTKMDRKTALEVLKKHQAWRRYNGPIEDSPDMQDPAIIGQAIDVAIDALAYLTFKPEKEYYGQ